jgi:hypothetical protein
MCHQIKLNGVIPSQKKDGGFFFHSLLDAHAPHAHTCQHTNKIAGIVYLQNPANIRRLM